MNTAGQKSEFEQSWKWMGGGTFNSAKGRAFGIEWLEDFRTLIELVSVLFGVESL